MGQVRIDLGTCHPPAAWGFLVAVDVHDVPTGLWGAWKALVLFTTGPLEDSLNIKRTTHDVEISTPRIL